MIRVRLGGGCHGHHSGTGPEKSLRKTPKQRGYLTFLSLGEAGGKFCTVVI